MYSTCTTTVTVTYVDTLTEWGNGVIGSTCTVRTRNATVTVTKEDILTEGVGE